MPGLPAHHQLPEFTQTHFHRVSDTIQPSHPLSSPSPPAFNVSQHQGLSNESVLCIRWPNIGASASASVLLMHIQCWVSFRINGFVLRAVQGTLKSLLQHHNSKTLILKHSAFFMVQLSHPRMTTGKSMALTIRGFVGKVMSLLFNMLSRLS